MGEQSVTEGGTRISSQRETLASLQAGRAIAALLVLLFHNSLYIFALDKYWGYDPMAKLFDFGHAGVEFFFVLSGFIIFYIHGGELGQASRLKHYLRKRFLRIYPVYWLVLACIVPIYFIVPSFGLDYHREASTILSSILLVYFTPELRTELAVAWTLYHEVLFYAMFALAIWNRRFGMAAIALWLSLSVATLLIGPFPFPLVFIASHLHLLFGMGILACWLLRHGHIRTPVIWIGAGLFLFLSAGMEENYVKAMNDDHRELVFGLGAMLALAGFVERERRGCLRVPGWLRLMGDASYSIYLTHFTLQSMLAKIFIALGLREALPALVSYGLMVVIVVLFGIVMHLIVEKPLLRFLNHAAARRPKSAPLAMCAERC